MTTKYKTPLEQGFEIMEIIDKWDSMSEEEKSKYESYEDFIISHK